MNVNDYYLVLKADLQRVRTRLLLELRDANPSLTTRWVSATEAVYAKDREGVQRRWEPYPFKPTGFSSQLGQLSGTTQLTLGNEDNVLTGPLDDGTLVKRRVFLLMAWLDPEAFGNVAASRVPLLSCEIDSAGLGDLVTLKLRAPSAATKAFPARKMHPVCQWEYGGPGCGPPGILTTCNHTESTSGGCGDLGTSNDPTYTKLQLGRNGGFYISAANL